MCMTIRLKEIPMEVQEPGHDQEEQEQQQGTQEQQVGQEEQDSKESVRARLLAISQVEPTCCEVLPLEAVGISKSPNAATQPSAAAADADDEFRKKLMGISYVEAALPEQEAFSVYMAEAVENAS
ncbi:unnamed protein product [Sphagnum jensenii]|uniref:Uncharacterized protein n=1 Tax=Sphagnum jensenii TaxID=128206 RepID=A0ABP1ARL0_9BRYO